MNMDELTRVPGMARRISIQGGMLRDPGKRRRIEGSWKQGYDGKGGIQKMDVGVCMCVRRVDHRMRG